MRRYAAVMAPAAAEMQRLLAAADQPGLAAHEAAFYAVHAGPLREVVHKLQGLGSAADAHIDQAAKPLTTLLGTLGHLTRHAARVGSIRCYACAVPVPALQK